MLKVVSSNEAKQRWGALLRAVGEGDEVVVENHGKPAAVVMSIAAYDELRELREQKRRADIDARIAALERSIGERNQDLSEEEANALAVRAGREIMHEMIDRLVAEGKISFERDLR
jgi:prevent-host-death family protein